MDTEILKPKMRNMIKIAVAKSIIGGPCVARVIDFAETPIRNRRPGCIR